MASQQADSDRPEDPAATDEYRPLPPSAEPAPGPASTPIPRAKAPAPARAGAAKRGTGVQKTSVLGDFRLVARLGEGGMGTVFRAQQISKPREVAVKVLSKDLVGRPGFVERFQREARLMARLDHLHIVRCYAVGESHGFHYLAMEFVGGGSLQSWLKRLGRLEVGDALQVVFSCARALGYAHDQGMVHRDVKPDNLLLTAEGIVKVCDLGLAKASDEDVSLTQTGIGIGTPLYASPEQSCDAKHADARSDLYALGSVLYHLIAGKLPFEGGDFLAVLQAKQRGVFTPLRRHRPEVSEDVDRIVATLLAKHPDQRYQSCDELMEDLQWMQPANGSLSFFAKPGKE